MLLSSSSDPHGLWPEFQRTAGSSRPSLTSLSLFAGNEGRTCKPIPHPYCPHLFQGTPANIHHRKPSLSSPSTTRAINAIALGYTTLSIHRQKRADCRIVDDLLCGTLPSQYCVDMRYLDCLILSRQWGLVCLSLIAHAVSDCNAGFSDARPIFSMRFYIGMEMTVAVALLRHDMG